jgi:hypothetical protein
MYFKLRLRRLSLNFDWKPKTGLIIIAPLAVPLLLKVADMISPGLYDKLFSRVMLHLLAAVQPDAVKFQLVSDQ